MQLLERRNQDPEELPMLELQIKDNDRAIQIFVQGIYIHKQKSVIAVWWFNKCLPYSALP